ncbi:MAG: mannose-6-phosphate isomerase, class I [Spirochaetaceae bacterium]|jgi:mannose-6-phosphate isomerase|nr:mannose-6-phosphate isomerase, class I [Spirochaetaceae bacterium]
MQTAFKLKNTVKFYAWGSPEWIPALMGMENPSGEPWAELWMGVHPQGPSELVCEGERIPLSALIRRDPAYYLGDEPLRAFGALPFLFKLLAAEKPLSIQAHPNAEQAREGWERENRRGLAPDAPERNYRDPNHKPELICALSPFRALCGFRRPAEIRERLGLLAEGAGPLKKALEGFGAVLEGRDEGAALERFTRRLLDLNGALMGDLGGLLREVGGRLAGAGGPEGAEWELAAELAGLYRDDPGVMAPLYLNMIDLEPGEGIYLPAGVLHSYVRGLGVEIMANSDNVLRGGLTAKHVDAEELIRILDFTPRCPQRLRPPRALPGGDGGTAVFRYPTACREFSLARVESRDDGPEGPASPFRGPGIVLVTQGRVVVAHEAGKEGMVLEQGESAFIPAASAAAGLSLKGSFTLYAAGCGGA